MGQRRALIVEVGGCPRVEINATDFQRHVSERWRGLSGSNAGGRWGPPGAFSVLYLGRPRPSVVVEAYRHLVDDVEGMRGDLVQPRRLLTVSMSVTEILDLTNPEAALRVGLDRESLTSPIGDYDRSWAVARAAHQLGLHGILAPSATGFGQTLALFEQHLPVNELPTIVAEERWRKRYGHIRDFEQRLVDEGTTIVKLFLHISKDEQRERFQERIDDPAKQWKFRRGDLDDRAKWDDFQAAYGDAISETSTNDAPWYVIPGDRNWVRNLAVAKVLVSTLEAMNPQYPAAEPGIADLKVI